MQTYSIKELLSEQGLFNETVQTQGWVRTRRDSRAGISFIALYDGSCLANLQLVVPSHLPNYASEVVKLTTGCSVSVIGKLVSSVGRGQAIELRVESLTVLGMIENPESYPISPKHHTLEYLREYAHLRPRTQIMGAVMRVRDCLSQAIHQFLHDQGFYWIHTPIITASDCEGAGKVFQVTALDFQHPPLKENGQIDFTQDFFGKEAYLTVSGQLHLESYCLALSKVYTFGPVFRAENSNTLRHLAESWMLEPEIAFADLSQNIDIAESLLKSIIKTVLNERRDDLEFFETHIKPNCIERLQAFLNKGIQRIDYTEAIEVLMRSKKVFEFPVKWGMDLQSEHERYLTETYIQGPVAVMNYPKDIKSFYMRLNDDGKTVAASDILVPDIGELIGGSQREERLDVLVQRMKEMNLDPAPYEWFIDLRRYGTVPHAGFGMGVDRLVCFVTGMANIRDVIPFPRTVHHAKF